MSDKVVAWLAAKSGQPMIRRLAAEILRLRAIICALELETAAQ